MRDPIGTKYEIHCEIRDQIDTKVAALDGQDLFAVLGLTRACTRKQVVWAHETLARWFDPGRLGRLGLGKQRAAARRIYAQLDFARRILADEAARRVYEALVESDLEGVTHIAA